MLRKLLTAALALFALAPVSHAYQAVLNPFTGKMDMVGVSSGNIPSGSGNYVQNTSSRQTNASMYIDSGTISNGLTVGSMTVTGPGNGKITFTISQTTYTVPSSSITASVGQYLIATSTNGTFGYGPAGGTPSGLNQLQYNLGGVFAGVPGSVVTGSSVSIFAPVTFSTTSILGGSATTANLQPGLLDIWNNNGTSPTTNLITAGSSSRGNIFVVPVNSMVGMTPYGSRSGDLVSGDIAGGFNNRIYAFGDTGAFIDIRDNFTSTMTFTTTNNNSPGDVRLKPAGVAALDATNLVNVGVQVSTITTAGYIQMGVRTKAQIGATTPTSTVINGVATGEVYYCSDCTTVPICVSTGTAQGAFAVVTNKATACN